MQRMRCGSPLRSETYSTCTVAPEVAVTSPSAFTVIETCAVAASWLHPRVTRSSEGSGPALRRRCAVFAPTSDTRTRRCGRACHSTQRRAAVG